MHTKFYYIINDLKLIADKWVKTSGLRDSGNVHSASFNTIIQCHNDSCYKICMTRCFFVFVFWLRN